MEKTTVTKQLSAVVAGDRILTVEGLPLALASVGGVVKHIHESASHPGFMRVSFVGGGHMLGLAKAEVTVEPAPAPVAQSALSAWETFGDVGEDGTVADGGTMADIVAYDALSRPIDQAIRYML